MADGIFNEMFPCSYKGAEFLIQSASTAGGRKDSKKELINSDVQSIEDLGLKNRIFTIEGSITARYDPSGNITRSYKLNRDTLLAALEEGGVGPLVHPFYGEIPQIVCRTWTLNEDTANLGDAKISIVFEFSNATGLPVETFTTPALLSEDQELIDFSVQGIIKLLWEVSGAAGGNSQDAVDKLLAYAGSIDVASRATRLFSDIDLDAFNELQAKLTNFEGGVNGLIVDPDSLALDMSDLMRGLDGIFSNPIDSYLSLQSMFNYGSEDVAYEGTPTFLSLQRQKNRDLLNDGTRAWALSYAYLEAGQVDYETIDDIITVTEQLETQYQTLLASDVDKGVLDNVTLQRADTQDLLAQQKLTARQVTDIRTNLTTTRLVSYRYYGTSEDGETLAKLNLLESLDTDGEIEVLTP